MNLFIEELGNYVIENWDEALRSETGQREARFVLQSLGPLETLALFERLESHAQQNYDQARTRCYFRTAKGLFNAWESTASGAAEAIQSLEAQGWIDQADKLTWYRNRLARDEGTDSLVVVLIGLNHATDQGGLADFHIVDEGRIQRRLDGSLMPWLKSISERLGLSPTDTELNRFNEFLRNLGQLRPLQLGRLARFLEPLIAKGQCYSFDDFRQRVLQQLPYWEIPPLLADAQGRLPDGREAVEALKKADAFIRRETYNTPANQRKVLKKLEEAINEPDFALPLRSDGGSEFVGKEDYFACLKDFVERADPSAKERLLGVDALPTVAAINRPNQRRRGQSSSSRIPAYDDLTLIAFLSALWDALLKFDKELEGATLSEKLGDIQIQLVGVDHDYRSADDDEDNNEGVRDLLKGLLGGLERRFEEIADRLSERWKRGLKVTLELNLDDLTVTEVRGRTRPSLLLHVSVTNAAGDLINENEPYRWFLDATQPERVRHDFIEYTQREWNTANPLLPAFQVEKTHLTALFYAADAEEANRLLANAMSSMELIDLREGLADSGFDARLLAPMEAFIHRYRQWLDSTLEKGYFHALQQHVPPLVKAYSDLVDHLLDNQLLGAKDLLDRVYKALLLIGNDAKPNDPYLVNCAAWGLSPAVLELSLAQTRFLADGFPEVLDELSTHGPKQGKAVFDRLLALARIQRPITALVKNNGGDLTPRVRGLGLIHCAGEVESLSKSLAVQTLLKEDESDDEEELRKVLRPCEEQKIVARTLALHGELHPYAADGLRILAVNVSDLSLILLGMEEHLNKLLNPRDKSENYAEYPPFECTLMVYSASASPLAMENQLSRWREEVLERRKEGERGLLLSVGHRYATPDRVSDQIKQERHPYDIAFLFHFLRTGMDGRIEATSAFDLSTQDGNDSFFPIVEYPRPIQANQPHQREMLLSNRRLTVQTRHADLSARLRYSGANDTHHVVLGQVDFSAWDEPVQDLHQAAHWVACIDSFVDKRLLQKAGRGVHDPRRKIVGFESGLGDYGELNLTISTETDTLDRLIRKVGSELVNLLPHQGSAIQEQAAERIVANAEEIAGLASLRAVLGKGQQIREVVGFAAINRMLRPPDSLISQLLPLDTMRDWLSDPNEEHRPDLLQLSLDLDENDEPLIHATVIECKLGNQNAVTSSKALQQVRSGLWQLSRTLAPRQQSDGLTFDRRYWWAQLQRAIASRGEVNLSGDRWNRLNRALEQVVDGRYRICWHGMVFTFWSDVAGPSPVVTGHRVKEAIAPSFAKIPEEFRIEQVELGHEGLGNLFESTETPASLCVAPSVPGVCIGPQGTLHTQTTASSETEPRQPPLEQQQPEGDDDTPDEGKDEKSPLNEAHPKEWVSTDNEPASALGHGEAEGSPDDPTPPTQPPASAEEITLPPAPAPIPERILIGTRPNGEPVYWNYGHPQLNNRHLLIFGTSGSGKTYGIQCLLGEMANVGLRSLIVDYTDGFLPGQMEPRFKDVARPKTHLLVTERLPLNPFRRQRQLIDPSMPAIEENNYQVASRIVSIFASVYNLGEQQLAALSRCLQSGLEYGPGFSFDELLPLLQDDGPQGLSLANKIEPFIQARPFRPEVESAWPDMLRSPENGVHVLQLKGLGREIQRMVTEFALWDLWDFAQSTGSKERPIPIVLDEIQNLDHSSDSPIDKMLREGRKFGLSLMLATQTTSNFKSEERDRLFQAGHKLFFKPATTETDRFAQVLAQATSGVSKADWAERLAHLGKGECWSLGPVQKPDGKFKEAAVLVSITALENRTFGG